MNAIGRMRRTLVVLCTALTTAAGCETGAGKGSAIGAGIGGLVNDGRVTTDEEFYRVVGNTLIVNDRDYIINGSFLLQGRTLTFIVGDTTSRWTRIGS
jgi:hypothetical protein